MNIIPCIRYNIQHHFFVLATLENEYRIDLKKIEKEVVYPRYTTLLGSQHLNNFTYNEGKAVYLKNIEKELGTASVPNLLGSQHLKNLG